MSEFGVEVAPTQEQRKRLDDWLSELAIISRKYELLIDTSCGDTMIMDLRTSTIVGVDLAYVLNSKGRITGYELTDSILDGVWMVRRGEGMVETRTVESVLEQREGQP